MARLVLWLAMGRERGLTAAPHRLPDERPIIREEVIMRAVTRLVVVVTLTCLCAALPAAAVTIDNFEEGNFNVVDNSIVTGPTLGEQTGLSTANVAGGVRLEIVLAGSGTMTAALVTSPADDSAQLTPATSGDVRFIYDGIAGGTTGSGTAGALNLNLTGAPSVLVDVTAVGSGITLQLGLWDADTAEFGLNVVVPGSGQIALPLGGFVSTTMNDINQLQIFVAGLTAGNSLLISNIQAVPVPEPGTAALLGIGLVLLAARAHRRG
jgi:hypothetical protein